MKDKHSKILLFEDGRMCTVVGFGYPDCQTILQGCQIRPNTGCTSYTEVSVIQNFKDKKMFYQGVLSWWCSAVLDYACIMLIYTSFYILHLCSLITKLKVSKSSYNSVLELSFVLLFLFADVKFKLVSNALTNIGDLLLFVSKASYITLQYFTRFNSLPVLFDNKSFNKFYS